MKELNSKQLFVGSLWMLALIGIVMRYSILGSIVDMKHGNAGSYLLGEEFVNVLIAFAGFWFFSRLSAKTLSTWGRPLILITLVVLGVVISGFSLVHTNGIAGRWIRLPVIGSIQPAELAKVALVIFMADFLTRHRAELKNWKRGFLPAVCVLSLMFLLIVKQPDFGTSVLLFAAGMWMMVVAGMKLKHFAVVLLAVVPSAVYIVLESPYRLKRILAFLNPGSDLKGGNYQQHQAKLAIAHGGESFPFGQGLMNGLGRHGYVPEASTDFIAAIYVEEFGFIGLAFMLLLYGVMIKQIMVFSITDKSHFNRCLLTGIGGILGLQIMINLFVITGLMPNKGMPLPLISSGGTSLLATACLLGLAWRVMKECPDEEVTEELEVALVTGQKNWNGL